MQATPWTVKGAAIIIALFLLGAAGTALMAVAGVDMGWLEKLYTPGGPAGGWVYGTYFPFGALYDYGEIPGILLVVAAAAVYCASLWGKIPARYKRPCLVIVLTVALGPGLLVNGLLKNYWGRPRPSEVATLGGRWNYQPVWERGIPGRGKSFPCGHCAMAFALCSLVALRHLNPGLAAVGLIGGIGYGFLVGAARMTQGGHFPTDVLWSAVLILALIALLYYTVLRVPQHQETEIAGIRPPPERSFPSVALLSFVLIILPTTIMLDRWPFYEENTHIEKVGKGLERVELQVTPASVKTEIRFAEDSSEARIDVTARGYGAPWSRIRKEVKMATQEQVVAVSCGFRTKGFFANWKGEVMITLPEELRGKVVLK